MKLSDLNEERLSVIEIPSEFFGRRHWEYTTDYIRNELGPIADMLDDDLMFYADNNYITNGPQLFLDNQLLSYYINLKQRGKRFYVNKNELVEKAVAWFKKKHFSGMKKKFTRGTPTQSDPDRAEQTS